MQGSAAVLDLLTALHGELEQTMALLGACDIAGMTSDLIWRDRRTEKLLTAGSGR